MHDTRAPSIIAIGKSNAPFSLNKGMFRISLGWLQPKVRYASNSQLIGHSDHFTFLPCRYTYELAVPHDLS